MECLLHTQSVKKTDMGRESDCKVFSFCSFSSLKSAAQKFKPLSIHACVREGDSISEREVYVMKFCDCYSFA